MGDRTFPTSVLIFALLASGCAFRSRSVGSEAEVKVPPKKAAYSLRPELKRFNKPNGAVADYLEFHSVSKKEIESRCLEVRRSLDGSFIVESYGSFVIATNLNRSELEEVKAYTLKAGFNALYRDYFDTIPDRIFTLYIFKNQKDYVTYSRKLFDEKPNTPYGYYRYDQAAVVVNHASGSGTLIHELVHALLDVDFPGAPTWFNEGFASLFEQSEIDNGSIRGLQNWRFDILREAVLSKTTIGLKELISSTTEEFYKDVDGRKYAQARFLCYYLQERGLLQSFYKEFRQDLERDPTGLQTLERVTGKSLKSLETEVFSETARKP